MDIHEYQAKELLAEFGVPVPPGGLAYSPEQAAYRRHELGGERVVVKAQVHSGRIVAQLQGGDNFMLHDPATLPVLPRPL